MHTFTMEDILAILPHRPPFLFVDRVKNLVPDKRIVTERDLLAHEPHFSGHFPGKPLMPGVLTTDALAQTAGLLWGLSHKACGRKGFNHTRFLLAAARMKYLAPAVPGQTLTMSAEPENVYGALFSYRVEALVGRTPIARGSLTLAMQEPDS